MRRKDKEITDRAVMDKILHQAQICRIAMCNNNLPYLVPMNFGYKAGYLYFHSAKEGKKINVLRENPIVSFEVEIMAELKINDKACNWGMKYFSVMGNGKVSFIEDQTEKGEALDIIMEKYASGQRFEYLESSINAITVFKIKIEEMTGKKSGY